MHTRIRLDARHDCDMVEVMLADRTMIVPYPVAFDLAQSVRMGAKQAAAADNAPGTFWRALADDSWVDEPKTHRGYRRSGKPANVRQWEVRAAPGIVMLVFDDVTTETGYEDAITLSLRIRRAAKHAKAWAGDTGKRMRTLANLTAGAA